MHFPKARSVLMTFVIFIKKNDICFLYETWSDKNSNVDFTVYKSYCFHRNFKHKIARQNSGGIFIYYKDHLENGIRIVQNRYNTLIWLKLYF